MFRTGFGMFVGPGQTEDQIQPVESDRISSAISNGAFPIDQAALVTAFTSNPNNRSFQPRAYANEYTIPERVYQYTASVQRELPGRMAATVAYVGSQGRNLFLRSVANNITQVVTNPNPANAAFVIRQFSIVQRDATGAITGVQNPYAEVDFKTSGGHDAYNALMTSLTRRSANGVSLNVQYTLGKSYGNTGGSNEADTAANAARTLDDFDYDNGYNKFDVRHTFNLSVLYQIPYGQGRPHAASGVADAILGGWDIGGIANARSGVPVNVLVTRPDVVYVDGAGTVFVNPAAGRTAVINTPRGGASRNIRRPDLIPGVDPFITNGDLLFLNPAAFTAPKPGTLATSSETRFTVRTSSRSTLWRRSTFRLAVVSGTPSSGLKCSIFSMRRTSRTRLACCLSPCQPRARQKPTRLQPGQPYTSGAAGTFGQITSTVNKTVGLGTQRQVQFAFRLNF